jgi:hypothetical protein
VKRTVRRLIATACCLLAGATLIFSPELGATLTQPPSDPGIIPKPSPAPVDPNDKEENVSSTPEDEEANDSPEPGDAGKPSPSPSRSAAHPDGAKR